MLCLDSRSVLLATILGEFEFHVVKSSDALVFGGIFYKMIFFVNICYLMVFKLRNLENTF